MAARINGARSRGPKTPGGKARSAKNATRHGLLAKTVVLPDESEESFEKLLQFHIDRFGPLDDIEFGLVEEMASSYWRMRRAWGIENGLLQSALADQPPGRELMRLSNAFAELASAPPLGLLHRYETRLHVMWHRAFHTLWGLRNCAIPNEPKKSPVFNKTIETEPKNEPENRLLPFPADIGGGNVTDVTDVTDV